MPVEYVAYIDESGDPGIQAIKPGGSPWFLLSCILCRANMVPALNNTHRSIITKFYPRYTDEISFKSMRGERRVIACEELALARCRAFVAISHKENILNHENENIRDDKDWLYWFMSRVLLEKVTDWCNRHSIREGIKYPKLRIVFSRRGGQNYDDFKSYFRLIERQSYTGQLWLNKFNLHWPLIDEKEIHVVDARQLAGLQLADILAGATWQALQKGNPEYFRILRRLIGKDPQGSILGFGLKTMPWVGKIPLNVPQEEFFANYGFKRKKR